MKTYKIIPGPKSINVERGSFTDATDTFASMINAEAQQGWEFHSLETISVTQKEGCSLKNASYTMSWEDGDNEYGYWTCPNYGENNTDWSSGDN